eukprot:495397_1
MLQLFCIAPAILLCFIIWKRRHISMALTQIYLMLKWWGSYIIGKFKTKPGNKYKGFGGALNVQVEKDIKIMLEFSRKMIIGAVHSFNCILLGDKIPNPL